MQKVTGNTEVMPLWADFASLDSVYEAVERFRRQFERVDVLINNCDIDPRNGREVHALTHDGYAPFMWVCQTDQKPMDQSADCAT